MKKLILAFSWIFLSVGVILTGIAGWYFLELLPNQSSSMAFIGPNNTSDHDSDYFANTAVLSDFQTQFPQDGEVKGVNSIIEAEDSRPAIVSRFLARHDSPLTPHHYYGKKLVEIADKYNLDFRLLPAIMMQESNLCKRIPEGTNNCLGFGIHSRGTLGFDTYEAGFERAAREIKANYVDIGLTTPEQIMRKYTPSSQGSWANSVNQWMAEMRYDDRDLGRTQKTNADVLEFVEPKLEAEVELKLEAEDKNTQN
jgi:hypothetical protein